MMQMCHCHLCLTSFTVLGLAHTSLFCLRPSAGHKHCASSPIPNSRAIGPSLNPSSRLTFRLTSSWYVSQHDNKTPITVLLCSLAFMPVLAKIPLFFFFFSSPLLLVASHLAVTHRAGSCSLSLSLSLKWINALMEVAGLGEGVWEACDWWN